MREIHGLIGKYRIESLLTSKRGQIQEKLTDNMRKIVKIVDIGVSIDGVYMQEVHPPIDVVPDYRAVASAREKKNEIIHKANGYANDIVPRSRGKGEKKILEAETYGKEKISQAKGIAESFLFREAFFGKSSALQIVRLRWDMIESLLFGRTIYIIPSKSRRRFYISGKFPNAQLNKSDEEPIEAEDEDIEGID
jgi:membrane protease subunit HflK